MLTAVSEGAQAVALMKELCLLPPLVHAVSHPQPQTHQPTRRASDEPLHEK